jgi:hypothetical protein
MQRNPETVSGMLATIGTLLDDGKIRQALEAIRRFGDASPDLVNAHAVALMCAGESAKAVDLLRHLVLHGGGVTFREAVPLQYKANYAAALMLSGNVAGCQAVLDEVHDGQHPAVMHLRDAMTRWMYSLPWWQRVWFKLSGESSHRPVTLPCRPSELLASDDVRPAAYATAIGGAERAVTTM